jgi:hypothetical protein
MGDFHAHIKDAQFRATALELFTGNEKTRQDKRERLIRRA